MKPPEKLKNRLKIKVFGNPWSLAMLCFKQPVPDLLCHEYSIKKVQRPPKRLIAPSEVLSRTYSSFVWIAYHYFNQRILQVDYNYGDANVGRFGHGNT